MIVKQGEIRANIKKYFDMAYDGEYIIVPRKDNKNIVIISEESFDNMRQAVRLQEYAHRISEMNSRPARVQEGFPIIKSYLETTDIKTENVRRLEAFREFKQGWNGYDAEPFSSELIEKVMGIIDSQDIQPEIFPTALGTIQLEYDNSRGDHMEMEIGMDDKAEAFIVLKTGQTITESLDTDPMSIKEKVGAFYG